MKQRHQIPCMILLVLSLLVPLTLPVRAGNCPESFPLTCWEPESPGPAMEKSPFAGIREDGTALEAFVYTFWNSNSKRENTASIFAYPLDPSAQVDEVRLYRRVNLEDGDRYSQETAGRLRVVMNGSYPKKTLKAIRIRGNFWLRRNGLPEIKDLQSGEAILATQMAIWSLKNGEEIAYAGLEAEGRQEGIHSYQNVLSLYRYLLGLPGEEPKCAAATEATLKAASYMETCERDGTYAATMEVSVCAHIGKMDVLTLSACWGGQIQSQTVVSEGIYQFTFQGTPDGEPIFRLEGEQWGGDVYLLQAGGETPAFLGYDASCQPVCVVVRPIAEKQEG